MFSQLYNRLRPYKAGEQPHDKQYIKLNTNENPYPPQIKLDEIRPLNLYSDPECVQLRNAISKQYNVPFDCIFTGNGSDEVLSFCFGALFSDSGKPVLFPDITYSFYPVYCAFYNIPYREVPLDNDYTINLKHYETVITADSAFLQTTQVPVKNPPQGLKGAQGAVIANPNAPTGILLDINKIKEFAAVNPELMIIVDEAYADFANVTLMHDCLTLPNVVIVRTLSKSFSLAGIRVGYAVGNQKIIAALNALKNSFNSYTISSLNQAVATQAINDNLKYMENVNAINATRDKFAEELNKIGYTSLPSNANFLFVNCPDGGETTYKYLKENGVLVRFFAGNRTNNFIRITIGTDADMRKVIEILKNYC